MSEVSGTMRQLRTLVSADGTVRLSLDEVEIPTPGANEVLVRIDAAPINPSDLAILFGGADVSRATLDPSVPHGVVIPPRSDEAVEPSRRVERSARPGTEGAGVVVATGDSPHAKALQGAKVAVIGSGTYADFALVHWGQCMVLPEQLSTTAAAAGFVNPLTALGMVETMRLEGHSALIHTAAASNLGRMLVRLCIADGVPLVNVVRRPDQAALLASLGAVHIVDSSSATFQSDLTAAIRATGATIAFDAIGGSMSGSLLSCMEAALAGESEDLEPYGSPILKQVYVYGLLDSGPIQITRDVGMAWSAGGWLLGPFLRRVGLERVLELRRRVVAELSTTFESRFTDEISLSEAVSLETIRLYSQLMTGQKYLLRPSKI